MNSAEIEIVKVGGSLLTRTDFRTAMQDQLRKWSEAPDVHRVLLVGGGPLVEGLRQIDAAAQLPAHFAHWGAIELMEVSAQIVGVWLQNLAAESRFSELQLRCGKSGITLFKPFSFLKNEEPQFPGRRLPAGWHVTSDSIAARLAICLGAARVRLLKSRPLVGQVADWEKASRDGLVDAFFPHLAGSVPSIVWDTLPAAGAVECSESGQNG